MSRTPLLRRRLRRFTYLRRRTIAALATALAVLAALRFLAPVPAEHVTIVAAAQALPGGTTVQPSDLTWVDVPSEAVPEGALTTVDAAVGRTLNGPLSARSPVTEASVTPGQQLAREGYVIAPLPLTDDTLAPLLQAGVHLDLLSSTDGAFLAQNVRVVATPESPGGDLMAPTRTPVLVEVTPEVAGALAIAAQAGGVVITVR